MVREKELVLPSAGEEQMGSGNITKREQGGVVWRSVDPYIIKVGGKQGEKGGRKFREEYALPNKRMMRPLACVASQDRMPDWKWVRSDRRAENPKTQKVEDKLGLIPGYR